MIFEFNSKLINSNSIKYVGIEDDPDIELATQRLDRQIETLSPKGWTRIFTTGLSKTLVEMLLEEKENLKQEFHIDIFFVDNSELRESYRNIDDRNQRYEQLKSYLNSVN